MPYIEQSTFKGNKYATGKHVDTIFPALFRKVNSPYTRQRLELDDGDFLDLDWLTGDNDKVIILFHGLEGSTHSQYIKGMSNFFNSHQWDVCAVNFRSCSGQMNRLLKSYHSGITEDIDEVMRYINSLKKYNTIAAGGFSLGGNVLLKYLGEQKFAIPTTLKVAFAFSVPIDLASSSKEMAKLQNTLYMSRFLKTLHQKMLTKAKQFKGCINIKGIENIKTFTAFDNQFTAPLNGFKDATDYYNQCNSLQFLDSICIPTLLVNAANDPFLTAACFPKLIAQNNPFLYLETPLHGGHVGFSDQFPNQSYWSETRAFSFISSICN